MAMKSMKNAAALLFPLILIGFFVFLLAQGGFLANRLNLPDTEKTTAQTASSTKGQERLPYVTTPKVEMTRPDPLFTVGSADNQAPHSDKADDGALSAPPSTESDSLPVFAPTQTESAWPLVTEFAGAGFITLPLEKEKKDETNCFVTEFADTLPITLTPQVPAPHTETIRAVYVATVYNLDFPSASNLSSSALRAELDELVRTVKANDLNTIFFQVRPASDALYASALFPTSRFLSGQQGAPLALDPLGYLVQKAHAEEIAVHAWINPYRVTLSGESLSSLAENNPARLHPEWTYAVNGQVYYNPAHAGVRALVAEGIAEILKNYAVDGVLFDDYFYPADVGKADASEYAAYQASGGHLSLEDWRRKNVNLLIELSYRTVKQTRADCLFGVSPRGIWRNQSDDPTGSATAGGAAYDEIFCDALAWVKGGYLDYLSPQIYWGFSHAQAPFGTLADWWSNALFNRDVELVVSLASYYLPESEIEAQKAYLEALSAYAGYALYNYSSIK